MQLGHYQVLEKLGEGGMGVVYRARDTHLERDVAIKVLPADKTADAERRQRFVREARAASALSHPGIVTVHDVASQDGVDFIVMEYLRGGTLDTRLDGKGLRLAEALGYAVQIADAMAAAHASGLVHRDLKPANLMVSEAGRVKVLDFGLAKLREPAPTSGDAKTASLRTVEGTILGTCAYMSPEQAEGRPVDSRSDVFSFGAVLYEMLTGRRAFQRGTPISTLSAILHDEPPRPRELVEGLPAEVERIVLRCLRKDPERRFQSMSDLKVALQELKEEAESGGLAPAAPRPLTRARWPWAASALLALGAAAGGFWFGRRGAQPSQATPPIPLTSFGGQLESPAISPDGNHVAFVWSGESGEPFDLYLKLVGPGEPVRLTRSPEYEGAPAWSPDGRQLAFTRHFTETRTGIVLIPSLCGPERKLTEGRFSEGIAWTADGQTLLIAGRAGAPGPGVGLMAVSLASGETRTLTEAAREAWRGDRWPALSPDGRTLAFSRGLTRTSSEIYVVEVGAGLTLKGEPRRLTHEGRGSSQPAFTPDGRSVLFTCGGGAADSSASLMIIPLSARGERARPLPGTDGGESPSISSKGRLVYKRWLKDENVWKVPLDGGRPAPAVRFLASTRDDVEPRFSPDGKTVSFCSDRSGKKEIWLCSADGGAQRQLTTFREAVAAGGARISPDGRRVVMLANVDGQYDIFLTDLDGSAPKVLVAHPGHDSAPSWSRDGKWVYFTSNREGDFQVWKMPAEPGQKPVRVTQRGGFAALESADGKTLYYARRGGPVPWAIWKMPVGGGEESLVIPSLGSWGDFDVTATGLYYLAADGRPATLRLHRFADGSETVLATLTNRPAFGVAAAPDDSAVLYSQFDVDTNELMLIESLTGSAAGR